MAVSSPDAASEHAQDLPKPGPHVLVLFGATGDLARRKLIPGLFHLEQVGLMPETTASSAPRSTSSTTTASASTSATRSTSSAAWRSTTRTGRRSASGSATSPSRADALARPGSRRRRRRSAARRAGCTTCRSRRRRGGPIVRDARRGRADRARPRRHGEAVRHRPGVGPRAQRRRVHEVFAEDQIFRIDHFLGKEAALNILALRFANGFFEPMWNREHIDHVQIDVPETLSIGTRGEFYEDTGAFRDMVVTHLFQVLAVRGDGAAAVARAARARRREDQGLPLAAADRARRRGARAVRGLPRRERASRRTRTTETFIALRVRDRQLALGRGAVLPAHRQAHGRERARDHASPSASRRSACSRPTRGVGAHGPDHLTFDLADTPRLSLSFYGKRPGPGMQLDKASMQFSLGETAGHKDALEAYERLIYDAMIGDRTLFTTAEGIERLWEISAPLLEHPPPLRSYEPGSWGPERWTP